MSILWHESADNKTYVHPHGDPACAGQKPSPIWYHNFHKIVFNVDGYQEDIWDICGWLIDKLGEYKENGPWALIMQDSSWIAYIRDTSAALVFKLTWGGK